jgi:two-component system, OmpR family, response regulator RegX3
VEPLGLLVEVLAGAADPTEAARILARLRGDAGALVEVLGVPEAPVVPRPAQVNDADGQADEPVWVAQPLPRGVLDRPTVLLVHQAEGLLEALAIGLSQAGLRVIAARDLHQALEIAQTVTLEVVVLGCGHGGLTASDAHSKLRTVTAAPMVLLDATPDKLAELGGRGLGGVVVLPRPLRFADLVAAVRQQLTAHVTAPQAMGSEVLAVGEVILDEQAHAVRVRGVPVEMPIKEFELLRVLLAHAGRAISRERVIELVWGTDFAVGRRNLHTHVKRLRQRIERDPTDPRYIVTIRGFGYRFNTARQQGQPA